ncbi:hypothetical protein ACHAXA_008015 [Cyclostephanos tholiformis]|uniref:Silicon transporter n=1 Tax=Cyclostephanos tholiformis TaxID=382380 RepID=A0ABD3REV8_9STRA
MCGSKTQARAGKQRPSTKTERIEAAPKPQSVTTVIPQSVTTVIPALPEEAEFDLKTHDDDASRDHNERLTPLAVIKYTLSLALLLFSVVVTVYLIFKKGTKLSSDASPWLAICILFLAIIWLGMMEGQQSSLVGLTGVVDHLVYRDTHPIAYKNITLAYRGNNLDRYVNGRQFMVVICVFVINLCGAPLPGVGIFGLPDAVEEIFLSSGLAMILMTAMISQLPPQVNASHCMIDFINNYLALFTLYAALVIEFLGFCHACYLVQNLISLASGKPVKTNEEPRTWPQSIFFWLRVLMSLLILGSSFAVTIVALFQGKTTMWEGTPDVVSLILFFVLLAIVGMLEAMQIAFLATSKMRKEHRGTSFFGKKTVEVISARNGQNLPAFMIGRQLMVVSLFFILARVTTIDVTVGEGENIFGVSDGVQQFLNTGLHAALLMTILGSSSWKLAASAFPVAFVNIPFTYILLYMGLFLDWIGICSGAWILAKIEKRMMNLQFDETYVGTPENPVLSKDALDAMSRDVFDEGIIKSRDDLDGPTQYNLGGPTRSCDALDDVEVSFDLEKGTSSINISSGNGSEKEQ